MPPSSGRVEPRRGEGFVLLRTRNRILSDAAKRNARQERKPMVLSFSKAWQDVEGRTECNEFRQWIALKIVFAVTRSTPGGSSLGEGRVLFC